MSSHAFVSAALSWTLRFLRNQTAVVMARADAKDARRRRSGGVVLSVQPELAAEPSCRVLSLQIASGSTLHLQFKRFATSESSYKATLAAQWLNQDTESMLCLSGRPKRVRETAILAVATCP